MKYDYTKRMYIMRNQAIGNSKWRTLIVICVGYFIAFLDLSIVNIIMPSITTYFKVGIDKGEWLISGYSLSISIMLLCSVWLARKFGFKRVYILGALIFTIASLLCSIAPNMDSLIAMRMLQGVGSGILIPLSMTIIAHKFTGKDRGIALGLLVMSSGLSTAIGPLIGGYFAQINEWNWVFRVNIPMGITVVTMTYFMMQEFKNELAIKFDYIGTLLLLIWAPLSLYALSTTINWSLITIIIIAFVLFVLRMLYAKSPLINIYIFKSRDFTLAAILMLCLGAVLLGTNYVLSEYLLHGLNYSTYKAGTVFIPLGIALGITAPITGYLTTKFGNRELILAGLLTTLLYLYLSSHLSLNTQYWYILMIVFLRGLGTGIAITAITNLSFNEIKETEIPSASGVINMIKQLSGSYSIPILTMFLVRKSSTRSTVNQYIDGTDYSYMVLSGVIIVAIIAVLSIRKGTKKEPVKNPNN